METKHAFLKKGTTQPIPIPGQQKTTTGKKEYSLKKNLFDPSKRTPPNDFLQKLQKRMSNY